MIKPPTEFQTERLLLRQPFVKDAEAIFAEYASDPEVTRYMTWVPHKTKESVSEFLEGQIKRLRAAENISWVLTKPHDNRPIGAIGGSVRGHAIEIGYVLGRQYWNRGYMTEAICTVADWLLAQPDVFRVWAVCDIENPGSARALEKSQFEREGLLRRWIMHPNLSSEPRDCYIYARIR